MKIGNVFNLLLNESIESSKLSNDIEMFLDTEFYKGRKFRDLLNSCELAKGNCDDVSDALYAYLLKLGYDDSMMMLIDLYTPKFETDKAHPEWQNIDKKYLVHTVLKIGDIFVDLTGSQYSPEQSGVKLYTKSDLSKLWGHYKMMKKDSEGKYIDGTSIKAKLRKF